MKKINSIDILLMDVITISRHNFHYFSMIGLKVNLRL